MNTQLNKLLLFCFIGLMGNCILAQTKELDSLKHLLSIEKTDTGKATIYTKISGKLLHDNTPESFKYAYKALSLSKLRHFDSGVAEACSMLGFLHNFNSTDSSYFYLSQSLIIKTRLKDFCGIAQLYTGLGTYYDKLGNKELSLKNYLSSLRLYDSLHIEKGMAGAALGAGNEFLLIKNYKQAIEYYQKSIDGYRKINSPYLSWAINNLADVYKMLNENKKAKGLYEESLKLKLQNGDFYGAVFSIDDIGSIYFNEKQYDKALSNYFKSLKMKRDNGLENETFANSYKYISQTFLKLDKNYEASLYIDSLESLAYQLKANDLIIDFLDNKCYYYINTQDYKNALLYKTKLSALKDSLLTNDMNKQVAEAEAKYNTEKKEKEIDLLNKDSLIKQKEIETQHAQRNAFIVGFILLGILLVFIYRGYRQKQKANILITRQKLEVEIQKQEVHRQKEIIEEHQKETIDSINYAKRIQYALLANNEILQRNLHSHFIFFQPKDIVSGDFYWATEHNNMFYLAVCDSTGHGVPGAFMSLLNMGFLSEAIKEKNISEPNEVLNYVRKRLIESIGNDGQQDGMDCILMCFDKTSQTISYSAANNEPILITGNQLIELPKDKMPVGKGEKNSSFTSHPIKVQKGDVLYLYTDGYADQFGGEKGKKFKYKQLNNLLLKIHHMPLPEQAQMLKTTFDTWKGNLEQVDDVLVVGIKI